MIGDSYTFQAELWRWESRADEWVFAALPEDVSMEIGDQPRPPSGFGSVRVTVRIGLSTWTTSIFPDAGRNAYVLPVKKSVRTARGIGVGDTVSIEIELVD